MTHNHNSIHYYHHHHYDIDLWMKASMLSMEHKSLLPYSNKTATRPSPEPPNHTIIIIHPSRMQRSSMHITFFQLQWQTLNCIFHLYIYQNPEELQIFGASAAFRLSVHQWNNNLKKNILKTLSIRIYLHDQWNEATNELFLQ